MSKSTVLEVKDIHKTYDPQDPAEPVVHALRGVSFSIQQGEFVAIVGPSGSGKSTLLYILGTLDQPSKGAMLILGQNPFVLKDKILSEFRNRHLGFVFQNNNLIAELSALENVMLPALIAGEKSVTAKKAAKDLLIRFGLEPRINHLPRQLSAGEQQRVAIARALVNRPALVLADEPTGNLDSITAQNVHAVFFEMHKQFGTTVLVVTHNPLLAAQAPRQLSFCDGRLLV